METQERPLRAHYLARPRFIPLGLAAGFAVLAAGYALGLRLAYGLAQGGPLLASAGHGPSYLADDLGRVVYRSVATMVIAPAIWGLVHYYGRRGPVMAAAYALAAGWIGSQTFARDAGPIDHLSQYLAYAVPAFLALMLAWRICYRRLVGPPRPAPGRHPALRVVR